MAKILVLHGPNLNLLGNRETEIYGTVSLEELNKELVRVADKAGHKLDAFQSNSEADLINRIQSVREEECAFIIINAAALTHTSVGLRDSLKLIGVPFIEVHISNVFAREPFRRNSYLSDISQGIVCGLGVDGYIYALQFAIKQIQLNNTTK